jgi:hypothetical protein
MWGYPYTRRVEEGEKSEQRVKRRETARYRWKREDRGRMRKRDGERERGRRTKGRAKEKGLLHEEKGVDEEEIELEVAYEDAYAMRTSTRQGGAP